MGVTYEVEVWFDRYRVSMDRLGCDACDGDFLGGGGDGVRGGGEGEEGGGVITGLIQRRGGRGSLACPNLSLHVVHTIVQNRNSFFLSP